MQETSEHQAGSHDDDSVSKGDSFEQMASVEAESTQLVEKHFAGIPDEWHSTIQKTNSEQGTSKLYFHCKFAGCTAVFKKSCNLRDHFRKHTAQRPYSCHVCRKTFTQSGNLGRHLKNIHQITRQGLPAKVPKTAAAIGKN